MVSLVEGCRYIYYAAGDRDWKDGYYFADETEDLNGPYESKEAAIVALANYVENLWQE